MAHTLSPQALASARSLHELLGHMLATHDPATAPDPTEDVWDGGTVEAAREHLYGEADIATVPGRTWTQVGTVEVHHDGRKDREILIRHLPKKRLPDPLIDGEISVELPTFTPHPARLWDSADSNPLQDLRDYANKSRAEFLHLSESPTVEPLLAEEDYEALKLGRLMQVLIEKVENQSTGLIELRSSEVSDDNESRVWYGRLTMGNTTVYKDSFTGGLPSTLRMLAREVLSYSLGPHLADKGIEELVNPPIQIAGPEPAPDGYVNVVFNEDETGALHFVEIESTEGRSIRLGTWHEVSEDGEHHLRLPFSRGMVLNPREQLMDHDGQLRMALVGTLMGAEIDGPKDKSVVADAVLRMLREKGYLVDSKPMPPKLRKMADRVASRAAADLADTIAEPEPSMPGDEAGFTAAPDVIAGDALAIITKTIDDVREEGPYFRTEFLAERLVRELAEGGVLDTAKPMRASRFKEALDMIMDELSKPVIQESSGRAAALARKMLYAGLFDPMVPTGAPRGLMGEASVIQRAADAIRSRLHGKPWKDYSIGGVASAVAAILFDENLLRVDAPKVGGPEPELAEAMEKIFEEIRNTREGGVIRLEMIRHPHLANTWRWKGQLIRYVMHGSTRGSSNLDVVEDTSLDAVRTLVRTVED